MVQNVQKEFVECGRKECMNEGKFKCTKCKLVSYCGRDCQVADWKPRHKAACKAASTPSPDLQQIIDSHSPDMIFYPETPGETPNGCSVRGTVGHEPMFNAEQCIMEGRIQKAWRNKVDTGVQLLGVHSPLLLALQDIGIASNYSEVHRAESQTLRDSEAMMVKQLLDLERRVHESQDDGSESFLFIPLEPYYLGASHALTEQMLGTYFLNQPELVAKLMRGYIGARAYIHKLGPHPKSGSRTPQKDLVGPFPFNGGLRLQCGMTPTLAIMHIHGLLFQAKVSSASEVFIFPHALVFASSKASSCEDGDEQRFEEIIKNIGTLSDSIYHGANKSWRTSGKKCAAKVNGTKVKHANHASFMDLVRSRGCALYPLFSDDISSCVPNT